MSKTWISCGPRLGRVQNEGQEFALDAQQRIGSVVLLRRDQLQVEPVKKKEKRCNQGSIPFWNYFNRILTGR
jgi:hypothetical protein